MTVLVGGLLGAGFGALFAYLLVSWLLYGGSRGSCPGVLAPGPGQHRCGVCERQMRAAQFKGKTK